MNEPVLPPTEDGEEWMAEFAEALFEMLEGEPAQDRHDHVE